jgi:hypothetical protein
VLEVFSRLNSYTVPVNPPELRHAKYQGEFKWAVHEMSQKWTVLWDRYKVVGARDAVRLLSDSLIAEMYGVVLEGVRDGGQPKVTALYDRVDKTYERGLTDQRVDSTLEYITDNYSDVLIETVLSNSPHFLMLFAAASHALYGIPQGDLAATFSSARPATQSLAQDGLFRIADVVAADDPPARALQFRNASAASTQRIASRRIRFPVYLDAIQGKPFGW